jgi:hypothetical protein
MPIYAATMGGKMVIGYGLLSATLQAIVAAFGAEGTEVISKTNDYLNRIAQTDPQRALLLAGFINEDPLLVCSLVETSKVRTATIRNKSLNAYHNGLIMPFTWQEVGSMDMTIETSNNSAMIISQATSLTDPTKYSGYYSFGGSNGSGVTITRQGTWTLNTLVSVGLTFAANTKTQYLRLCGWQNANWTYDITIAYWNIYDTAGDPFVKLVPFLTTDGEVCFLDLVNLQLHHNVYIDPFTIQLTDQTPA